MDLRQLAKEQAKGDANKEWDILVAFGLEQKKETHFEITTGLNAQNKTYHTLKVIGAKSGMSLKTAKVIANNVVEFGEMIDKFEKLTAKPVTKQ